MIGIISAVTSQFGRYHFARDRILNCLWRLRSSAFFLLQVCLAFVRLFRMSLEGLLRCAALTLAVPAELLI